MKKLDYLILKSAFGPFIITLFVGNLVFLMQFLYHKLDELIGKGLSFDILAEFVMYASLTLVPQSLPLAVLIASIMTMGNLGERYELVAIKSSGVSLLRAMLPLIIASFLMSGIAFYFSNSVIPHSLLRLSILRWDIQNKKPTMLIQEGVFFNGFEDMAMRVGAKGEEDENKLYDLTIYDHRKSGETKVIKADSAYVENSDTTSYMVIHLMDGKLHEDANLKEKYTRFAFKNLDLVINMSDFEMGQTSAELFRSSARLKTVAQINHDSDSIRQIMTTNAGFARKRLEADLHMLKYGHEVDDSLVTKTSPVDSLLLLEKNEAMIYANSINRMESIQQTIRSTKMNKEPLTQSLLKHEIAWYQKFALAFSCVILFFIGAPMGSLVRKGGFGMPILIAIIFYLIYHIFNIVGTQIAEKQVVSPVLGIWLATIALTPIAFYLTKMAIEDRKITIFSQIGQGVVNFLKRFKKGDTFAKK